MVRAAPLARLLALGLAALPAPAAACGGDFGAFVAGLAEEARARGIPAEIA